MGGGGGGWVQWLLLQIKHYLNLEFSILVPCLSLPGLRAHFWSYRVSVHVCVCVCVLGEGGGGCGAFLKPKVGCGYHTKISNYQRYILRIDKFSYHILLTLHGRLKSWQWKLRHRSGPVTG